MKKRRRMILTALAFVIIASIGLSMWQTGYAEKLTAQPTAASVSKYQTATVHTGSLSISITGSGKIVSSKSVDLGFSTSGEVAEVDVQIGDTVKAGQVLATLGDTAALELKVKEEQVAVQAAEEAIQTLTADGDANLAQSLLDQANAEAAYEDAKIHLRYKGQGRCEESVTESYYFQWLALQKEIKPWKYALTSGKTDYGKDFILEQLRPLVEKSNKAYENWSYCQTFTDEEIETSQANLQLAKAKFDLATRNYATLKANSGIDATSLSVAQANLKNAKLQLAQAQADLEGTKIIAPRDGVVTAVNGAVGDKANTGIFITLTDLDHPQVLINIDETDLSNFAVGCPAVVTFDSLSGQSFSGSVSQVYPSLSGIFTSKTAAQPFTIESTDQSGSMVQGLIDLEKNRTLSGKTFPLGLTASAEITCSQEENILLVAAQGLYQPQNGTPYVYILNSEGQPEKREVEIGMKTVALVEIKSGLSAGDRVIISAVESK